MATTKDYRDYILEQLELLDHITCRPMMGEYLLYQDGILFGGIYDDRLLLKKSTGTESYHLEEQIPYTGAKPMYFVSNTDDKELLRDLVLATCKTLPIKKAKH